LKNFPTKNVLLHRPKGIKFEPHQERPATPNAGRSRFPYVCKNRIFAAGSNSESMTTITVSYDQNNTAIRLILQALRELGAKFHDTGADTPTEAELETLQAIDEMRRGDTVKYDSFEDFKRAMYEL
jgi:hypothetical protein